MNQSVPRRLAELALELNELYEQLEGFIAINSCPARVHMTKVGLEAVAPAKDWEWARREKGTEDYTISAQVVSNGVLFYAVMNDAAAAEYDCPLLPLPESPAAGETA